MATDQTIPPLLLNTSQLTPSGQYLGSISSPWFTINSDATVAQTDNGIYNVLGAISSNHAVCHVFPNPNHYAYLEMMLCWWAVQGTQAAVDVAPIVQPFMRTGKPNILPQHNRLPWDLTPNVFPQTRAQLGASASTMRNLLGADGLWSRALVPGYTVGTPDITLSKVATQVFTQVTGTNLAMSFGEPVAAYIGGCDRLTCLVKTAGTFSSSPTTPGMAILARLTA